MLPVYCISLQRQPDRLRRTRDEFGRYGIAIHAFPAIDGQKSKLKATVELHHDGGVPYFIGDHHIGIILSHLMVWHHIVASGTEAAMIVQDDVKLCTNFPDRFYECWDELPADWEYVWVGHCCAAGRPCTRITSRVWEVRWPMCDHCILVKRSGLEKMLEPMNEFRAPLDIALIENVFSKGLVRTYTFLPGLALQYDTDLSP